MTVLYLGLILTIHVIKSQIHLVRKSFKDDIQIHKFYERIWAAFGIMRLLWGRDARSWPVKLCCGSVSPSCHSDADTDPTFDLDADPAFHPLDADLDPAPHQKNAYLWPLVYRPSTTPFWAAKPSLSVHGLPWLNCAPPQLLNFAFDVEKNPAITPIWIRIRFPKNDADPDPKHWCELQLSIWYWVGIPTYRFGEISVGLPGVEVQAGGGVVLNHPGEHRVLRQVVERPVCQAEQ